MRVSVVTPSLNKSFKFQSDWPYNNSQVYLLNSILEDLEEDEERTFEATDDGYVFTSKVNYPNNKALTKQNVYMNKDSKITKVEVVDKDNNALISMNYSKIEYDKKFDDDYFELNGIIKLNDEDDNKTNNQDIDDVKSSDDSVDNQEENATTQESSNSDTSVNNENTNTNNSTNTTNNSGTNNTTTNESNSIINSGENTGDNKSSVETASIDDVIYPMYLPDNTYLTNQEKVSTTDGERLILTFGGDDSFTLVEETISAGDSNIVIPVSGEFDFLSDVIGVIGTNSVMWHSNGIEYYMTSNTLETSELVDIARSISVLPVSK